MNHDSMDVVDNRNVSCIEAGEAEYLGSVERNGKLCDYYKLTDADSTSFFYIVRTGLDENVT